LKKSNHKTKISLWQTTTAGKGKNKEQAGDPGENKS